MFVNTPAAPTLFVLTGVQVAMGAVISVEVTNLDVPLVAPEVTMTRSLPITLVPMMFAGEGGTGAMNVNAFVSVAS